MAISWHFIKRKCEDAVEALVTRFRSTYLTGIAIYKGASMTELTTPRLQIVASAAEPQRLGGTVTGNWMVEMTVALVSHYGDVTRTEHMNRSGELDDIFMMDLIEDEINNLAITNFKIFPVGWKPGVSRDYVVDGEIITEYTINMYCCPSVPE